MSSGALPVKQVRALESFRFPDFYRYGRDDIGRPIRETERIIEVYDGRRWWDKLVDLFQGRPSPAQIMLQAMGADGGYLSGVCSQDPDFMYVRPFFYEPENREGTVLQRAYRWFKPAQSTANPS
jgi:hypothetical protein